MMKASLQSDHKAEKRPLPVNCVLERSAINEAPVNNVPAIVYEVLQSPGQALDAETRDFFEPRFGHDFSYVRVHTNAKAAESARAVSALAYTAWPDIVFGLGQYQPFEFKGRLLLEHELAHVVQQEQDKARFQSNIRNPAMDYRLAGEHNLIQRADDWTLNELLQLGPTLSYPKSSEVKKAQQALRSGKPSLPDLEILLQQSVADFRAEKLGKGTETLSNEDLALYCGLGRDVSVISLGTLVRESPEPISIYRFQALNVFEGANQHAFAVVVFPNGKNSLLIRHFRNS